MTRDSAIPTDSFEAILAWLNPDRDLAASMYLQLRAGLEKLFSWAECSDPEWLTDETFDRVARKVHDLRQEYKGDPRLFFYGVAKNLIKEDLKKVKTQASLEGIDLAAPSKSQITEETAEMREECLHSCLQELNAKKRELIVLYYSREKQAKIDHRAELARQLGTSVETLRVRVYRIREALEKCIGRCVAQKVAQRK